MKSGHYSSFEISSSRLFRTCDPRWRRRRRPATRAATGSPACALDASSRPAGAMRAPSRSPACRTRVSAPRPPARKPTRPPPPRRRDLGHSRTSCGPSSTSYKEKASDYATKPNSCAANWTIDIRRRQKNPSSGLYLRAGTARTWYGSGASGMPCWPTRPAWRRRRRPARAPAARPARPPPRPWAAWTARWRRPRARRASRRPTPRSSRRFSKRAIPSSFDVNCSFLRFRISHCARRRRPAAPRWRRGCGARATLGTTSPSGWRRRASSWRGPSRACASSRRSAGPETSAARRGVTSGVTGAAQPGASSGATNGARRGVPSGLRREAASGVRSEARSGAACETCGRWRCRATPRRARAPAASRDTRVPRRVRPRLLPGRPRRSPCALRARRRRAAAARPPSPWAPGARGSRAEGPARTSARCRCVARRRTTASSLHRATTLRDAVGGRRLRVAGGGVRGAHRAPGRAGSPPGLAGPPPGPPAAAPHQAATRRPRAGVPPVPHAAPEPGAGAHQIHPLRGRRFHRHEDQVSGRGLAVERQAPAVLREHELRMRRRREGL